MGWSWVGKERREGDPYEKSLETVGGVGVARTPIVIARQTDSNSFIFLSEGKKKEARKRKEEAKLRTTIRVKKQGGDKAPK
jgi:hypothetical protein